MRTTRRWIYWFVSKLPQITKFIGPTSELCYRGDYLDVSEQWNDHNHYVLPVALSFSAEPETVTRLLSRYLPTAANRYLWIRKIAVLTRAAICLKPLSFQQRFLLTYSYNIVFLHSPGCISILPTWQTLITLIAESDISSRKITLTLSFQRRNLQTYRYDIVFLHSPGCINMIPTCQTLITLITESFISSPKLTLALAALNCHPPLQS